MPDSDDSLPQLYARLSADGSVRRLLELARDEDLGQAGDITTAACVSADADGRAAIVARAPGVIGGLAAIPDILAVFGSGLRYRPGAADGESVESGAVLGVFQGRRHEILTVERTVLNVVGRLSGIATRTAAFVKAVGTGVRARVYDTRKTTPGLRALEKYAVRCGGGCNHRFGLFDAVLIKDNHLAGVSLEDLPRVVAEAAKRVRGARPSFIEVEVASIEQLERVLTMEEGMLNLVLLDNMPPAELRRAVAARDARRPGVELEASGGVSLQTIRQIAETGVERISVGSLTHGAASLDVALDMLPDGDAS